MTAQLAVAPNPATSSTVVDVSGSGFANAKTRLLLDGVGSTTNVFRPRKDGTFGVGITVSASVRIQTLVAQQAVGSKWLEVARTTVAVQKVVVTPPPPSSIARLTADATAEQYRNACYDMSKDEVWTPPTLMLDHGIPAGSDGPQCYIAPDRTSRPLVIRPADGVAQTVYSGAPGSVYYTGQFRWGGKFITRQDVAFENYLLSQAGAEQLDGPQHLNLLRTKVSKITRYAGNNPAAYKTWGIYGSGAPGSDVLIEDYEGVGGGRDSWSLIQFDSTAATYTRVTIRRIKGTDLCYGFYENIPMVDLVLEDWALTNVGYVASGAAISFHQAKGTYARISLVNSGKIAINGSQMVPG